MNKNFRSTYGLGTSFSYKSEVFKYIPLTWKLGVSRIEALKIRIAKWRPKCSRNNQAIFYFDVNTEGEANAILSTYKKFNFKKLEKKFDDLFESDNVRQKNTGETRGWLCKIIPELRAEFNEVIIYKDYELTGPNEYDYYEAISLIDCDAYILQDKTFEGLKTQIDEL